MKVQWEEKDILVGRYVTVPTESGKICASRTYKIGFLPHSGEDDSRYCLIAITDGMVGRRSAKERLAETLTAHGHVPISTEHLVDLIRLLHRQNEGIEGVAGS